MGHLKERNREARTELGSLGALDILLGVCWYMILYHYDVNETLMVSSPPSSSASAGRNEII